MSSLMIKRLIYKILFIAFFIVFLIFVVSLVLFTPTHVESEMSVETETLVQELQVSGLVMKFEEGITEPEVKTILENCNLTMSLS